MSFEYNGREYYCADDEPGQHDYEYNTSLADADSRWDSNSKARDTLSSDYGYSYQTAKTVIQSVGRSIRNKDDYATTYIIDSNWDFFYKKNQHLFNDAFKKCIQS